MIWAILKRFFSSALTLWAIITVAFFMMKLAPGGPFDTEKTPPPAIKAAMEAKYHLDRPMIEQYYLYMKGVAKMDFGPSFKVPHLSVTEVIEAGIGYTLKIGMIGMLLSLIFGVAAGLLAALNHNKFFDHLIMSNAMIGISVPTMVLGPITLLIFGLKLRWVPVSGLNTIESYILPSICLSLFYIANIARLTRGSMLEVLHSNYVRTARAKGIPLWKVVLFHCLKPTLIPVISYLGPAAAGILAGSLVVEKIFVIPGVGRQFVDSAFARDYTMAMGMIIFYCMLVIVFNALVDVSYFFLDPQIRKK